MKVKVTGGWSLGLEDQPERYTDGEVFDAPDALAAQLIANGQAVAVKAAPKPKVKAVKASKNKAVTVSPNKSTLTVSPPTPPTPVVRSGR